MSEHASVSRADSPLAMRLRGALAATAATLLLAGCVTTEGSTPETVERVIEAEINQPHGPLFPALPQQAASAHPANACLTADEAAAHHVIRLHTELMVTGLTCRSYFADDRLFDHYQTFTFAHQDSLRASQGTLGRYLARYQSGNSNRLFDNYRTLMANNESRLVQALSASRYCEARRDQFYAASTLDREQMADYLTRAAELYRDSYTPCSG